MSRRWPIACLVLSLALSPAWALTDEEVFREFRFNLINPGARSLGLGGAYLSLAEDATAAQANPAGLSLLNRPEYFAELRAVDNGGRSTITRDTSQLFNSFVATGTDLDDNVRPSFLSAVTPYGRWSMGLSVQDLLTVNNRSLSAFTFAFPGPPSGAIISEGVGTIDVNVVNYNVSAGVRATDNLRVGATLTLSRVDFRSELVNRVVDTGPSIADEPILEPVVDLRTTIDDNDNSVVFSLGLLYRRPKWSVGAVYRRGPDFEVIEQIDPLQDTNGDGQLEGIDLFGIRARMNPNDPTGTTRFVNRFHLPDVAGVGGHWLPLEPLTLALNLDWIRYSNLLDGYIPGMTPLAGPDARFTVDDAVDYRLGVEWLFFNTKPILALRGGVSSIGDSTIRAVFTGTDAFASEEAFPGGDRQPHGSLGLGINLERWKIDLGADFSETDNEYLISVIYRSKGKKP